MFLLTSIAHFAPDLRPDLVGTVPPWMPRAGPLVTVSGLFEAAGAIGLLVPAAAPRASPAGSRECRGRAPANRRSV
ncbi:hypothetical protein [Kitasatospora purpeofusca]|uniref:hypothetical protein n=1 Tax=Kitasatospora purpeofusca TaxID=67352 RepID=UPI003F4AAE32